MTLVIVAIAVAFVLLVVLNRRRWQTLGHGTRAFGRRLNESYHRPGQLSAHGVAPCHEHELTGLTGFALVATDGLAGTVMGFEIRSTSNYLVVSIDPLVAKRTVAIPTSAIIDIGRSERQVHVDRTKEELATAVDAALATTVTGEGH